MIRPWNLENWSAVRLFATRKIFASEAAADYLQQVIKETTVPGAERTVRPHLNHRERTRPSKWTELVSAEEWNICQSAINALRHAGVDFLLGGAFGLATYTGRLRDTKDIDLFVLPHRVERAIDALGQAGFEDYYPKRAYDRGWIYRSTREGFIVDIIFRMANRRADVDEIWFARARPIFLHGEELRVIPAEEMLWQKLYVLQRDRCDWPDILNLIYCIGPELNWEHLFERMGDDLPLLRGVLDLFDWLCPELAAQVPRGARRRLHLPAPVHSTAEGTFERRVRLLDSRRWFVGVLAEDEKLEL